MRHDLPLEARRYLRDCRLALAALDRLMLLRHDEGSGFYDPIYPTVAQIEAKRAHPDGRYASE